MCKISRETVIRANQKMISKDALSHNVHSSYEDGNFVVVIHYGGRIYSSKVSQQQMRNNYRTALERVGSHAGM